jgi:hypothetical protein
MEEIAFLFLIPQQNQSHVVHAFMILSVTKFQSMT